MTKTEKKKSLQRWVIFNIGTLLIFLLGQIIHISFFIGLADGLFWFAAISGTLIWIGLEVYEKVKKQIDFKIYLIDSKEALKKVQVPDNTSIMDRPSLEKMASFSVPYKLDLLYDIFITGMLVYFDYTWLPLFYLAHMVGLWKVHVKAQNFLLNGPKWEEKELKESQVISLREWLYETYGQSTVDNYMQDYNKLVPLEKFKITGLMNMIDLIESTTKELDVDGQFDWYEINTNWNKLIKQFELFNKRNIIVVWENEGGQGEGAA